MTLFDDYFSESELAEAAGCSVRTLQAYRTRGIGPAYAKVFGKIVYPRVDAHTWLKSLVRKPVRVA